MQNAQRVLGYISQNVLYDAPKNLAMVDQRRQIEAYVAQRHWELVDIWEHRSIEDSGEDTTALEALIQAVEARDIQVVVVPRLDRLTRNIRLLSRYFEELCQRRQVGLVSIDEQLDLHSEGGQLVSAIIGIVAKWENKRLSDRTRAMIARKRSRGERVGHAPFGYTYRDKRLVPDAKEQRTLALILRKRETGMSYHGIAQYLNGRKIGSKRGGIWYAETIKKVLLHAAATENPAPENPAPENPMQENPMQENPMQAVRDAQNA